MAVALLVSQRVCQPQAGTASTRNLCLSCHIHRHLSKVRVTQRCANVQTHSHTRKASSFFGCTTQLARTLHVKSGQQHCSAASTTAARKIDLADRVVASLPYLIPLFDGLRYGKFFFLQFPVFSQVLSPLEPLIRFYFSFPFAGILFFFAVYLGIVRNLNFTRYVRFNAMQSVLLDILLVLPGLLESVMRPPLSGPGLQVYISIYNSIWLFIFVCVAYAVASCLTGNTPRLPLVADAADQQIQ